MKLGLGREPGTNQSFRWNFPDDNSTILTDSLVKKGENLMGDKGSNRERSKKKIKKKPQLTLMEKRKLKKEKKQQKKG